MGKNKRSRAYYIQSAKRHKGGALGPGMVGFMCTCNNSERDCVREAYNVLNELADTLYGEEFPATSGKSMGKEADFEQDGNSQDDKAKIDASDMEKDAQEKPLAIEVEKENADASDMDEDDNEEPLDIEAALKADVSELKKNNKEEKRKRRFHQVQCSAKNCIFIQTTLQDPLPLSLAIMDDILLSKKQKTKKLLRMIPVQATCKAFPEDIKKAVEDLSATYFKEVGKSFCVVFKVRNNSSVKKESMVFDLARIIQATHPKNIPDLNFPEVVVNVNVIKNVCCLSILPHYFTKYCKYNLVQLAGKDKACVSEGETAKDVKSMEGNNANGEIESTCKSEGVTVAIGGIVEDSSENATDKRNMDSENEEAVDNISGITSESTENTTDKGNIDSAKGKVIDNIDGVTEVKSENATGKGNIDSAKGKVIDNIDGVTEVKRENATGKGNIDSEKGEVIDDNIKV